MEQVFLEKKPCEIDPARVKDGNTIETNLANLKVFDKCVKYTIGLQITTNAFAFKAKIFFVIFMIFIDLFLEWLNVNSLHIDSIYDALYL